MNLKELWSLGPGWRVGDKAPGGTTGGGVPGAPGSGLSGEASALVFSAPHSPNYTDSPGTLSLQLQEIFPTQVYSKAKFACYSRCFLTSYFCIPAPYNEKDIFLGCRF